MAGGSSLRRWGSGGAPCKDGGLGQGEAEAAMQEVTLWVGGPGDTIC